MLIKWIGKNQTNDNLLIYNVKILRNHHGKVEDKLTKFMLQRTQKIQINNGLTRTLNLSHLTVFHFALCQLGIKNSKNQKKY